MKLILLTLPGGDLRKIRLKDDPYSLIKNALKNHFHLAFTAKKRHRHTTSNPNETPIIQSDVNHAGMKTIEIIKMTLTMMKSVTTPAHMVVYYTGHGVVWAMWAV